MEVSLYSVAAIEGYVPEGGLQGHKKQRILKKKHTCLFFHTSIEQYYPGVQV